MKFVSLKGKTVKRIVTIALSVMLAFTGLSFSLAGNYLNANAATRIGRVTLSKWKEIPVSADVDGIDYRITWKKVKGATGYQVKEYEKEYPGEKWYVLTGNLKKTSYDVTFSSLYAFKVRVRAYKKVNGKKYYGPWTESKIKIMDW